MPVSEIYVGESFEALTMNPEPLLQALSPWLMTRRWSGLGGLSIEGIEVLDWMKIASDKCSTILASIVKILPRGEVTNEPRIFYIPLHIKLGSSEDGWTSVICADGILQLREGEYSKGYNDFLLQCMAKSSTEGSLRGALTFKVLEVIPIELEAEKVAILGQGDTTNIVVKVETMTRAFVLKTYKNVTENNPEPEMLAALIEARFENAPKMVGETTYIGLDKPLVLTTLQRFIENGRDGSRPFAEELRHELMGNSTKQAPPDSLRLAQRLGEVIASMHHALGHSQAEGFGTARIVNGDIKEWKAKCEGLLEGFLDESSHSKTGFETLVSELVALVASKRSRIVEDLAPMDRMLGMMKIRTHQDLHLLQLLTTHEARDFLIIDFEGDPQRTGEARRQRECPLRDLGTMARSFSYLRYVVLKELLEERGCSDSLKMVASSDLTSQVKSMVGMPSIPLFAGWISISRNWEDRVRKAMIKGYLAEANWLGDEFLSKEGNIEFGVVDSIVRVWEIDKALLESRYELHHRPENLIIPLAGLLALCR